MVVVVMTVIVFLLWHFNLVVVTSKSFHCKCVDCLLYLDRGVEDTVFCSHNLSHLVESNVGLG